jgi:hypothetical protein
MLGNDTHPERGRAEPVRWLCELWMLCWRFAGRFNLDWCEELTTSSFKEQLVRGAQDNIE